MSRHGWTCGHSASVLFLALAGMVLSTVSWPFGAWQMGGNLEAAPHSISPVKHPFDPDWLEVKLILAVKCANCHNTNPELFQLSTYEQILSARTEDGEPAVVPLKPEQSALWDQVAWNAEGRLDSDLPDSPMMPEDHLEWLTVGQIETIGRWIRNGALEYSLPKTCSTHPLLEIDFPSAKECKSCHPRQYDQWSRSMHHYAQQSPTFEAFNLSLQERTSGTMGTFCSRCHTPIGTALGENGSRRNVHRSRLSLEGVTCVVCHRQSRPFYKSNARFAIEKGDLLDTCMFGPFDDPADPPGAKNHPATGMASFKKSSFCGTCHDVTSPGGVRLEEAYSEWQNSPAAKDEITCQQCHMGPVQGIAMPDDARPWGRAAEVPGVDPKHLPLRRLSDHTFAGPDYSLLPDTEFPNKLDWMYEKDYRQFDQLSAYQKNTLIELRHANRRHLKLADEKRYELLKNAAGIHVEAPSSAQCGGKVRVRVDVTSKVSGHSFPTGFTAERQAWVDIRLTAPNGQVVFRSGDLDDNGDLRNGHSHAVERGQIAFDKHLLSFQNLFIALTRRGTDRSVMLPVNRHFQPVNIVRPATDIPASFGRPQGFRIAKTSLPPLATIGRTYPMRLPSNPGRYRLEVRLNFRHLPPALLDKIGLSHRKHLLEIVVIDQYESVIHVCN